MNYLFVLLFFVFGTSTTNAQDWKELSQSSLNLKYQLPHEWYVGGYALDKNCNYTGTTLNASKNQGINMVIFSSKQISIDSLKNKQVWGYNFAPSLAKPEIIKTSFLSFEKALSTWVEDKETTVFRFASSSSDSNYLIYFWGKLEDITKNSSIIEHILESIQTL